MITLLAEKPSVARELAALLGATSKKDGYLEGNGYYITWALGHLISLGLPEDYGIKGFHRENLPILPSPFLLTPRKGTGKERLLPEKSIVKQLLIVGDLFKNSERIIVATDAGREGELIFRYIYDFLNCRLPFMRLWVSSLTEKALRHGLDNLLPGSDFDNLYLSARARSRADWLVGINASQALSIAAASGVYSLGRVQTPTLALICRQYMANRDFKAEKYWQLQLTHTKSFTDFKSYSRLEFETKVQAEEALKSIQRKGNPIVTDVSTEIVHETAPLLYDLTALQKAANRKYGFSASQTLEIAQGLYEKQFITYPRTGSKYITEDLWPEVPQLIKGLAVYPGIGEKVSKIRFGKLNRHIVNENKVTDHHGLLITEKVPSALSANENVLYQMIAIRLLEAVSDTCSKEKVTCRIEVLHYEFHIKSFNILEAGWRGIQDDYDDQELLETDVPELSVGDHLNLTACEVVEKQRKGPELFTEATLLSRMEHPEGKSTTKTPNQPLVATGLGTPATRAAIIETLLSRGYIERKGKSLLPTPKGESVYELVKDMGISSVGLTAEWEKALSDIEHGSMTDRDFQQKIEDYTNQVTMELLQATIANETMPKLLCPMCKTNHLRITEKVIKCPDEKCAWIQFRQVCGIVLPIAEISKLITDGATSLLKGMKSKSGKAFSARLVLSDSAAVQFAFEK